MNEVKTNDDKQLLEALGKGDHKAFDCIFRKYYVDVVMFCGRFMDRVEDCEDISQSLFLHIWDMREMIPSISNFRSYLLRSAQNMCLNELHRCDIKSRFRSDQLLRVTPYTLGDETNKMLFYSELQKLLAAAEATLEDNEREAWRLSRHEGLKYSEIAVNLGVSVRTVEDRMRKAKKHFLKVLDRYWIIVLIFYSFLQL